MYVLWWVKSFIVYQCRYIVPLCIPMVWACNQLFIPALSETSSIISPLSSWKSGSNKINKEINMHNPIVPDFFLSLPFKMYEVLAISQTMVVRNIKQQEIRGKSRQTLLFIVSRAFPGGSVVKNLPAKQETWVWSLGREDPWRRKWPPAPVVLPGESHGQRSLAGYSPWGHKSRTWFSDWTITTFTIIADVISECSPTVWF